MHVVSPKFLSDYSAGNAQAKPGLDQWLAVVRPAQWNNLNEVKATYNLGVDYIANHRYVFNIKGNHYRLIVIMFFEAKRIYIRGVYTHTEYNQLTKKQIIKL